MQIEIRECSPGDQTAILSLAERLSVGVASWRDSAAVATAVRGWVEQSTAAEADVTAFVACNGDDVVGFISVSKARHFAGETDAYIGELIVDESAEGCGVGSVLVDAAEKVATAKGHRCITLSTGAANTRALAFYRHRGYIDEDIKLTKVLGASGDS